MGNRIQLLCERLFRIRPNEFWLVQSFFSSYFFIGMFLTVSVTAGDALLLANVTPQRVNALYAWLHIGVALVSIAVTWVYHKLAQTLARSALLLGMLCLFLFSISLMRILLSVPTAGEMTYLWLAVWLRMANFLLIMGFFSLLGDYFSTHDAKRLYGYIAGGLAVGSITAGGVIGTVVAAIGAENLLYLCMGFLAVTIALFALVFRIGRPVERREPDLAAKGEHRHSLRRVLGQSHVRLIFSILLVGMVSYVVLDFQMKVSATAAYPRSTELASFLGRFYMQVGIVEILFQFLAVGRLLKRLGILWCLMILPGFSLVLNALFFATGLGILAEHALAIIVLANLVRIVLSESLDLPSRELLFLPLPTAQRLQAQSLTAGMVMPLGQGIGGAVVIFLSTFEVAVYQYSLIGLALSSVWIGLLLLERPRYRQTLVHSLKSHQLNATTLHTLLQGSRTSAILGELLALKDRQVLRFALGLVGPRELAGLAPQIRRLALDSDEQIAARAIALLGQHEQVEHLPVVEAALESSPDPVRAAAVTAFCRILKAKALERAQAWLESEDPVLQKAAIVGCGRYGGPAGYDRIRPLLAALAASPDGDRRLVAARALEQIAPPGRMELLAQLLGDPDPAVQTAAIAACAAAGTPETVPQLLRLAGHPALRAAVQKALMKMPRDSAPAVIAAARTCTLDDATCHLLFGVLAAMGGKDAQDALWAYFCQGPSILVRVSAGNALRQMRPAPLGPEGIGEKNLERATANLCETIGLLNRACREIGVGDPPVWRLVHDRARLEIENLFNLLAIRFGSAQIDQARFNIIHSQGVQQANALELLDEILPRRIGPEIVHLLDGFFARPLGRKGLSDPTAQGLILRRGWLKVLALDHLQRSRAPGSRTESERLSPPEQVLQRLLKTVVFLGQVSLFQRVPGDYLAALARVARRTPCPAGRILFAAGDRGDALYLIEEGLVEVVVNRRRVATLGPGEVIGEMALIDGAPRSASCIAQQASALLRIDASDFEGLLGQHPDFALALLRTLAERLRRQMEKTPRAAHGTGAESPGDKEDRATPGGPESGSAMPDVPQESLSDQLERIAFLHRVPLFADVPQDHLWPLARLTRLVRIEAGGRLFAQGDRGDAVYLIRRGAIRVEVAGVPVNRLAAGECLGEMALIDDAPRSATAIAAEDSELLRIKAADFETVVRSQPPVLLAMLGTLAQRLRGQTVRTASVPPRS